MPDVMRVIYVDDEPALLEIGKLFLEDTGAFSVVTSDSASAALARLKKEQFDAIISDFQMPGMDGIQFLTEVRKNYGKVPFILFTGRGREEIVIQAINKGADFYLQKGGEPQSQFAELSHKIRTAVERRISDNAFHASEDRYHSLVDTMHDSMVVYQAVADGEDFVILEFNKAAEKVENISRSEVIGHRVTEVFPGVLEFGILDVFRRVWRTGTPESFPISLYKDNRISGWRDNYIYKLPTGEIVADYSDETARRQAEEALQKSEEKSRLVLEATNDGIWDWNVPSGTAFFSPRWYTMIGYEPGEMPGTYATWRSLLHPEDLGPTEQKIQDHIVRKDEGYSGEFRMRTKQGTWKWILARGKVVERDAAGNAVLMVGTHTDIDELKKREKEILDTRNFLTSIIEQSPNPLWISDEKGTLVQLNQALCDMLQVTPEEVIGRYNVFEDTIVEEQGKMPLVRSVFDEGKSVTFDLDYDSSRLKSLSLERSTSISLQIIIFPIRDSTGKITNAVIEEINNTGRRQIERELERKNQELLASYEQLTASEEELRGNLEELTRQERVIKESEAGLRAILDATPFPVALVDLQDNNIDFWSRSALTLFGHTAPTAAEWYLLAYPDPRYRQEVIDRWKPCLEQAKLSGQPVNTGEYRVTCRDGSVRICELYATFLSDKLIVTFNEITDRKNVQEALQASEARYRLLFEGAAEGILVADIATEKFLYANNAISRMLGYSPEELTAMRLEDIHPPKELEDIRNEFLALSRGEKKVATDIPCLRKDKTVVYADIVTSMVMIDNRPCNVGFFTDITERKTTDMRLRNALSEAQRFREALDQVSAYIYIKDPQSRYVYANRPTLELFGCSAEELAGSDDIRFFPLDTAKHLREVDSRVLQGEHTSEEIEIAGIKNGRRVYWEVKTPIFGGPGNTEIVGLMGISTDITQRKRMEEALRESGDRFHGIFDTIPSGVAIYEVRNDGAFGKDYIIKDFNRTALELEGKTKADVIGKSLFDLRPAIDEYGLIPVFRQVWETGVPSYFPQKVYLDENFSRWYENRVFRLDSGEIVAVYDDITERKRAEEDLHRHKNELLTQNEELHRIQQSLEVSHDQYVNLYDLAPVGYITSSDKGLILKANLTAASMLATERSTLLNCPVTRFIVPEDQDIHYLCRKRLEETNRQQSCELRMLRKGTSPFWAQIIMERVSTDAGEKADVSQMILDITERKEAQEALQKSEQEFHTLAEAMPQIVWITRADGWNIYFNQQWVDYTGLTLEESYGHGWNVPFHPDDRQRAWDAWQRATQYNDVYSLECRLRRADGVYRWWLIRGEPLLGASGEILKWFGTCTDIEEIKRAEEALRESEEKWRSLVNVLPDYISLLDRNGTISFLNQYAEGFGENEVLGSSVYQYLSVISRDNFEKEITACLDSGKMRRFEHTAEGDQGLMRDYEDFLVPVIEKNKEDRILVVSRDITERKQAGEALAESNAYLNNLFNYANAPIIVWDPSFVITRFNHAFENLTLRSEQEVIGKHLDILFPDESKDRSLFEIKKTLDGVRWESVEIPILTRDGSIRTVLWNSANIVAPSGSILSTIAQGIDITDRKEVERAFKAANKKLNLLSSITRHDINNQMTVIRGYTTLLQKKQSDPSFAQYYEKINTSEEQIASMIQFAKMYEDIGVNAPVWQDVGTLVDLAAKDATLGDIHIVNEIPGGTEIFADPLIARVFYNLLDNAVRHGGRVTTIRFTAKAENREWIIVCEDDGEGVLVEDKEKIYERGYGKNTGLGLFLSREILAINGITIKETGEPGKGARFEISVPRGAWRITGTGPGRN